MEIALALIMAFLCIGMILAIIITKKMAKKDETEGKKHIQEQIAEQEMQLQQASAETQDLTNNKKRDFRSFLFQNRITVPKSWLRIPSLVETLIFCIFAGTWASAVFPSLNISSDISNYIVPLLIIVAFAFFGTCFSLFLLDQPILYFYYYDLAVVKKGRITPKPVKKTRFVIWICIFCVFNFIDFLCLLIALFTFPLFAIQFPCFTPLVCLVGMFCLITSAVAGLLFALRIVWIKKGYENGTISEEQLFAKFKVTPPKSFSTTDTPSETEQPQKPAESAQPASSGATTEKSMMDQLKEYKELKDNGLITEEEYEAKRKEILKL